MIFINNLSLGYIQNDSFINIINLKKMMY